MYLFDGAENMPVTKTVLIIQRPGNFQSILTRKKIIGLLLYFQIIQAANYAYTLKAVWIKSSDNNLSNYQATFKGKYLNLLKRLWWELSTLVRWK